MQQYKKDFIEFLVRSGALTFGDFTTKSGRKTPYFINTGNYRTGTQLARLGEFYAQAILDNLREPFDNLYGPAYKGIPLAVAAAIALSRSHSREVSVTYNRKEAKDHGEKGTLIGHQYDGSEKVVVIEDVITAGTSIRQTMALLEQNHQPQVLAVLVSVDRMERGTTGLSAVQQIRHDFNIPTFAIVTIKDILAYLPNRPVNGNIYLDNNLKEKIESYLTQYGTTCKP